MPLWLPASAEKCPYIAKLIKITQMPLSVKILRQKCPYTPLSRGYTMPLCPQMPLCMPSMYADAPRSRQIAHKCPYACNAPRYARHERGQTPLVFDLSGTDSVYLTPYYPPKCPDPAGENAPRCPAMCARLKMPRAICPCA